MTPLAGLILHLPGFRTAHNGRLVIFLLFALALLAGFGAGRADAAASCRRCGCAGSRSAAVAAIFCVPIVWMLVAGTIDLGQTKAALKVAWAFRDPPAAVPGVHAGRARRPRRSSA